MATATQDLAAQQEYMSLAPGVGIIPEQFRNKGYDKLEFAAGEGGIRPSEPKESVPDDDRMGAFLDGVAAGADPKELAGRLADKPKTRGRAR